MYVGQSLTLMVVDVMETESERVEVDSWIRDGIFFFLCLLGFDQLV